ncbi:MAG: SUMF1/EgtB/PvdO family nonheme iron enzyme [Chitinophagaceae bacterium]
MKKIISFLIFICAFYGVSFANNISTSNIYITGQNAASDFSLINFNLTWDNSWRTSTNENNWDGAWVFIKFRKANSGNWQHATINYASPGDATACGHTAPSGSFIKTPSDGKGAFIYRSAAGSGTVNWSNIRLRWNYGADGVLDGDSVEIRLFAIEMVYCPQGNYNLGSGGTEYYHFRDGAVDTYYPVTSENAITCGNSSGNLWSDGGIYWFTGTLPAAFPKGYAAVWCMKYEVSQQQYIDFLNTIDYNKYINRNSYNSAYITGTHPNLIATYPERAMTYISCLDLLALLDWSALRPFTELEYEKIARGNNQMPVANEYAWGNTTITQVSNPTNAGTNTETWTVGNCNFTSLSEAIRCGALATATSNRTSSGASYYGVMELSGNVYEWAISAYDAIGRAYTGAHGDGYLAANGNHDAPNWSNTSGSGLSIRGGALNSNAGNCTVSDRTYGGYVNIQKTGSNMGGRGCRTGE